MGKFKHGFAKRGLHAYEYSVWSGMISRCTNPNVKCYSDYGGRGIKVCADWMRSFLKFKTDMGNRPIGATIDRINNNGNYEPGNCRWATAIQQSRNRSDNRIITANGKTLTLVDWCKETGFSHKLIHRRIDRGWNPDLAVTVPPLPSRRPTIKEYENLHKLSAK